MDDEEPPPLGTLSEQVAAVKLRTTPAAAKPPPTVSSSQAEASGNSEGSAEAEEKLPTAAVFVPGQKSEAALSSKQAIRKGFFDAPKPARKVAPKKPAEDNVIEIKAKRSGISGSGPNIPDFMRLEPDEQAKQYGKMKEEMLNALKPDQETIKDIASNPTLLAGFDDPEVMAAINDVAAKPENIKKYANNPKVKKFYEEMGKMMGSKLEKMQPKQ